MGEPLKILVLNDDCLCATTIYDQVQSQGFKILNGAITKEIYQRHHSYNKLLSAGASLGEQLVFEPSDFFAPRIQLAPMIEPEINFIKTSDLGAHSQNTTTSKFRSGSLKTHFSAQNTNKENPSKDIAGVDGNIAGVEGVDSAANNLATDSVNNLAGKSVNNTTSNTADKSTNTLASNSANSSTNAAASNLENNSANSFVNKTANSVVNNTSNNTDSVVDTISPDLSDASNSNEAGTTSQKPQVKVRILKRANLNSHTSSLVDLEKLQPEESTWWNRTLFFTLDDYTNIDYSFISQKFDGIFFFVHHPLGSKVLPEGLFNLLQYQDRPLLWLFNVHLEPKAMCYALQLQAGQQSVELLQALQEVELQQLFVFLDELMPQAQHVGCLDAWTMQQLKAYYLLKKEQNGQSAQAKAAMNAENKPVESAVDQAKVTPIRDTAINAAINTEHNTYLNAGLNAALNGELNVSPDTASKITNTASHSSNKVSLSVMGNAYQALHYVNQVRSLCNSALGFSSYLQKACILSAHPRISDFEQSGLESEMIKILQEDWASLKNVPPKAKLAVGGKQALASKQGELSGLDGANQQILESTIAQYPQRLFCCPVNKLALWYSQGLPEREHAGKYIPHIVISSKHFNFNQLTGMEIAGVRLILQLLATYPDADISLIFNECVYSWLEQLSDSSILWQDLAELSNQDVFVESAKATHELLSNALQSRVVQNLRLHLLASLAEGEHWPWSKQQRNNLNKVLERFSSPLSSQIFCYQSLSERVLNLSIDLVCSDLQNDLIKARSRGLATLELIEPVNLLSSSYAVFSNAYIDAFAEQCDFEQGALLRFIKPQLDRNAQMQCQSAQAQLQEHQKVLNTLHELVNFALSKTKDLVTATVKSDDVKTEFGNTNLNLSNTESTQSQLADEFVSHADVNQANAHQVKLDQARVDKTLVGKASTPVDNLDLDFNLDSSLDQGLDSNLKLNLDPKLENYQSNYGLTLGFNVSWVDILNDVNLIQYINCQDTLEHQVMQCFEVHTKLLRKLSSSFIPLLEQKEYKSQQEAINAASKLAQLSNFTYAKRYNLHYQALRFFAQLSHAQATSDGATLAKVLPECEFASAYLYAQSHREEQKVKDAEHTREQKPELMREQSKEQSNFTTLIQATNHLDPKTFSLRKWQWPVFKPLSLSVLSFGCSRGDEIFDLLPFFNGQRLTGIDINPSAILNAQKHLSGLEHVPLANAVQEFTQLYALPAQLLGYGTQAASCTDQANKLSSSLSSDTNREQDADRGSLKDSFVVELQNAISTAVDQLVSGKFSWTLSCKHQEPQDYQEQTQRPNQNQWSNSSLSSGSKLTLDHSLNAGVIDDTGNTVTSRATTTTATTTTTETTAASLKSKAQIIQQSGDLNKSEQFNNEPQLVKYLGAMGLINFVSSQDFFQHYQHQLPQYDVVTVMTVLCRHPETLHTKSARGIYNFEDFEDTVVTLDKLVKKGGLLCIFNSNYALLDTCVGHKYVGVFPKLPMPPAQLNKTQVQSQAQSSKEQTKSVSKQAQETKNLDLLTSEQAQLSSAQAGSLDALMLQSLASKYFDPNTLAVEKTDLPTPEHLKRLTEQTSGVETWGHVALFKPDGKLNQQGRFGCMSIYFKAQD